MKTKLLIFLFALMFFVSLASAFELDNVGDRINPDEDGAVIIGGEKIDYNPLWEKYPALEVKNAFGFGETYFSGALKEHTEICSSDDCESIINVYTSGEYPLVEDFRTYTIMPDGNRILQPIRSVKFSIAEGFYTSDKYNWFCNNVLALNGSTYESCNYLLNGSINRPFWKEISLGQILPAGNYILRIEGEKRPDKVVDWQIKVAGEWTTDWSLWGTNYGTPVTEPNLVIGNAETGYCSGIGITAVKNVIIRNITLLVSNGATNTGYCRLLTTYGGTILDQGVVNGRDCIFPSNISLVPNTQYVVCAGNSTGNFNGRFQNGVTAVAGVNINYTGTGCFSTGAGGLCDSANAGQARSIANVTSVEIINGSIVQINSPAAGFTTSNPNVTFNATINVYLANPVNASLWINSTGTFRINSTNTITGTNNNTVFSLNLSNTTQNYLWNIQACDSDGACGFTNANRTLSIDPSGPITNVTYPNGIISLASIGQNLTVNFTVSDSSLQSCWYNYDNINYTISCGSNASIILTSQKNLTFYANDSAGNIGSTNRVWNYSIFINSYIYSASAFSNNLETFKVNTTIDNSFGVTQVNITYNNTDYVSTASSSGPNTIFSRTLTTPSVNSQRNITFFWEFDTTSGILNSLNNNQSLLPLFIDNCTANSFQILNYTIYDEDARSVLNPATANITANLFVKFSTDFSGTAYNSYANTTSSNPIRICLSSPIANGTNYRLDSDVQYSASGKVTEYHIIENVSINNNTIPLAYNLYDLATTSSQEFLITFKDSNYNVVSGALVEIDRQYLSIGQFLPVEISRTDTDGKTIGHFVLNDQVYTIYVRKNGQLLATYNNVRVYCSNSECKLNLNQAGSSSNPSTFKTFRGVLYKNYYNMSSRVYNLEYITNDGSSKLFNLTLFKFDNYGNNSLCSSQVTSFSGTLTCTVPGSYNSTVIAKAYVDGEPLFTDSFKVKGLNTSGQNPIRYFLAFLLIVTLPLLAVSSGVMTLVFLIVGIIFVGLLSLVDFGGMIGASSAIMWIVIAAIVLIWKASKGREDA